MVEPFPEPIYVTRPYLPPLEEFAAGLEEIWRNQWLTNNGPVAQRFAGELSRHVQTENLCLMGNGTLALTLGLKALGLTGEVITTPFTFVATAHALLWNGLTPVFADIEPDSYNLDPARVEAAITPRTSAILAVHVFGRPCDLAALEDLARRRGLKLIFDAAHAFGVTVAGRPISHWGDLSMFSFHATKPLHSGEGGLLVFRDPALKPVLEALRNFGLEGETQARLAGTNAKMTELQALLGLCVLGHFEEIVARRRAVAERYRQELEGLRGIRLPPPLPAEVQGNYAYFPIEVVEEQFGATRDQLWAGLRRMNVHARRYFFPLVSDLSCYRELATAACPHASRVAQRILTLPIYDSLPHDNVDRICAVVCSAGTYLHA